MNKEQLNLFENKEPIETTVIQPTKDMPFEIFKACCHLSYFMELMERLPDGRVIWDQDVTSIVSENIAEVEYSALQNDYFTMNMELPKKFIEKQLTA